MTDLLNRGDMKLLTEAGYSALVRGIDTDVTPIFEALDTWMPEYAAGPIGLALQQMVRGDYEGADARLAGIRASGREGAEEATAMLAFCKALRDQLQEAEKLAEELKATGGHAEAFTHALLHGGDEDYQDLHALAAADEAMGGPAPHGSGQRDIQKA